jgi:hypothetical protein
MATEEGEGGGMEDVERSLETPEEREGFFGSVSDTLGDLKERYVDFHRAEEESDRWGDQQVAGGLSRRGFISLAGQTAVAGYGISEATDNDGWAVDWSGGQAEAVGPGGGPGAAPGNETENDGEPTMYEGNELGVQGDVSDELYLQEDGTVVAIDYGHKEWRAFNSEDFQHNQEFQDLYDELEDSRGATDLAPPGLSTGVEVSQQELFNHDTEAYDDMADEAEWDLIFDSNPNYAGGN